MNTWVEIYDLDTPAKYKFESQIQSYGGRFTLSEKWKKRGVGISGLEYHPHKNDVQLFEGFEDGFKVIFELSKNGMIIYMRNRGGNYGLLLHDAHISHFSIYKKNDLLTINSNSFVSRLLNAGFDYLKVRNLVLESDKIEFHELCASIHLTDGQQLNFEITKFNPMPIIKFFETKPKHKTEVSIDRFTVIPGLP